MEYIDLFLDIA